MINDRALEKILEIEVMNWDQRRALRVRLERITARFAYCVAGVTATLIAFHLIQWVLS